MKPRADAPAAPASGSWLLYDGGCPFCAAYVRKTRLGKSASQIRMVDARDHGPELGEARAAGLDVDRGMVLKLGDRLYHGDATLNRLALLTSPADPFNRLTAWAFASRTRSRLLYPWLRHGRKAALALLCRRGIGT